MLDRQLAQHEFPSENDIFEANKAPKDPTLLQQIGRHRLIKPLVQGAGALMMLVSTACSRDSLADIPALQSAFISVAEAAEKPRQRIPRDEGDVMPKDSFRNLQRSALQRTALQSFDYQTVTDMNAQTYAARCATTARTNPINGTFSVPMTDVLFYGRMYVFSDLPEYEAIARDPNSVANINVYLGSVTDFWRHFYGIRVDFRTQAEPIPLGNFRNDGQLVYRNGEELGNRGLQVAPAPQGDRPGQYVVPFDVYMADVGYPMIGRPLGNHGQVVFHPGPILDGVSASHMEDAYHEAGHSFGLTHNDGDPNNIMQTRSSVQPFRVAPESAAENCPAASRAFRINLPISPRVAALR